VRSKSAERDSQERHQGAGGEEEAIHWF